jgi:hypothetical protein
MKTEFMKAEFILSPSSFLLKGCSGGVEPATSTFTESHACRVHHEHHQSKLKAEG